MTDADIFVAEQEGPPRRRYWIARDPRPATNTEVRGWSFTYDEAVVDGHWRPGGDAWEQWFFEIIRYAPEYAGEVLVWRRATTGHVVDLDALQRIYDGRPVSADETPESAGLASGR